MTAGSGRGGGLVIQLQQILVATDFSDASGVAFSYGRELARSFGATLHVLHVVDLLAARIPMAQGHGYDINNLQAQIDESAHEALNNLISDEDREKLHAEEVVIAALNPADAIVTYADEHRIDIIVMGTHGRSGLSRLMVGSVAERVVRFSPCPVLTVRHPEHEFIRPDALERRHPM
jgi:nucleotide-binding universal stress UspA family protein